MTALPFNLTSRDRRAVAAYDADCASIGTAPTDEGRAAWVREWRQLDEETRQDALGLTAALDTPSALLAEAVETWGQTFASDDHVSGADLVEWFAQWLERAATVCPPRVEATVGEHHYRVGWEIDIYADTPEDAARKALEIQRNPDSIATQFNVSHGGQTKIVDFHPEDEAPAPGGPA